MPYIYWYVFGSSIYLLIPAAISVDQLGRHATIIVYSFFCWCVCIGPLGVAEVALVRWTNYGVAAAAALSSTASVDAFPG